MRFGSFFSLVHAILSRAEFITWKVKFIANQSGLAPQGWAQGSFQMRSIEVQ